MIGSKKELKKTRTRVDQNWVTIAQCDALYIRVDSRRADGKAWNVTMQLRSERQAKMLVVMKCG